MRAAVSLIFAIALAACAQTRWQKAGADEADTARDLSACRKLAHQKMQRMWGAAADAPRAEISPVFGPTGPSQADIRMQETQAVTVCMRERGYALAP
jgi:hypothetical protein